MFPVQRHLFNNRVEMHGQEVEFGMLGKDFIQDDFVIIILFSGGLKRFSSPSFPNYELPLRAE
jgi:hypothetical protein